MMYALKFSEKKENVACKKISFKLPSGIEKKNLSGTCAVTISIGQKAQEGGILGSTLELINANFSTCDIMLCDTLQKYNWQMQGLTAENAYYIALQEGDNWIRENRFELKKLIIPHRIIRWDEWLYHADYGASLRRIQQLYKSEARYKMYLDRAALDYIERCIKRNFGIVKNYNKIFDLSIAYLQEECAVMLLWVSRGYDFEIYPNKRNTAMAITSDYCICPSVLKPIYLDIRTKKGDNLWKIQ